MPRSSQLRGRQSRAGARRTRAAALAGALALIGAVALAAAPSAQGALPGPHHQLLDAFDGVPASQSSVAAQLADVTGQVAASKHASGHAGTAARLRVAAAVFGA